MNWHKIITVSSVVAGLIVSVGTIIGGISYYINQQYVPRSELTSYYSTLNQNNQVILGVLKQVGGSFYSATLLEMDTAIDDLESKPTLTFEQRQHLEVLKLIRDRLERDKNILQNIELLEIED